MELRPYQQECIDTIESQPPGAYLCQMATGTGKTCTFANIPRQGRVLVLAHREELVRQPAKYYDCPVGFEIAAEKSHGEEVVIASVQSMVHRLDRFSPDEFDMIITDECFTCDTEIDGKKLTEFKRGDIISSYSGKEIEKKPITHVFKRKPSSLIGITLEDGTLIKCTKNHPIYVEGEGYKAAAEIKEGDYVRRIPVHNVRETRSDGEFHEKAVEKQNGFFQKIGKNLLFPGMLKGFFCKKFKHHNGENKPEVCQRENEKAQSHEKPGDKGKGFRSSERNRPLSENQMWKRSGTDRTTAKSYDCSEREKSVCRVCNPDKVCGEIRNTLSDRLQSGHCSSWGNACNRSGREQPLRSFPSRTGQKEGVLFEHIRVASVEVYKQTSDGTFGGMCPDGFVYNFEVKDNHNYFANGVLVHNCHHAASPTYKKIYSYFNPRKHIGFTATPNRGDKIRLDNVFQKIIFQRDLRWAILHGYLTDITCKRVNIGFDLSAVHTRRGDYAPGELNDVMDGTADAIAQAYRELAVGATLIFAVSVHQAEEIATRIDGAVVVTGKTKDRASIIQDFTAGKIPCIVNCMVFTEGTDIPRVETVIIARPTQSEALYAQMVGRGLRLYPGKKKLTLIDCVGVTGHASLCTAPSLLGIDMENVPESKKDDIEGDLFELPDKVVAASDVPESWIKNVKIVDLWAKEQSYNTHDVNFFKMPDGSLVCSLAERQSMTIPCPDSLGMVNLPDGSRVGMQEAIDRVYTRLCDFFPDQRQLWDLNVVNKWGKYPATPKQLEIIKKRCKGFDTDGLTKGDASQILNRLFNGPKMKRR